MSPPTRQGAALLAAIRRLTVDGVSPSYEQLQAAIGIKSKSGIHRQLAVLRDRGLVEWDRGRARSIRIIEDQWGKLDRLSDAELHTLRVRIDVLLRERAGVPA